MYVNIATRETVDLPALRRAFPHMSFPADGPDDETLAAIGRARLTDVEPPTITETQAVAEGPPELADGVWRQTWVVSEMPAEIVAAKLAAAKTAACANIDARAEELRAGVLTPGSGQAMEYYQTHAEAVNFLAAEAAVVWPPSRQSN